MTFIAVATRDRDSALSSYVNSVILATIYAQENHIRRSRSIDMPLLSLFGSDLSWALRDAIGYSGNYDEIYAKHFEFLEEDFGGPSYKEKRGRNIVNTRGGPQIHAFPGLG